MKAIIDTNIIEVVPSKELVDYYEGLKNQSIKARK